MDTSNIFATGGASASIMLIVGLLYRFWGTIVGHELVVRCCGRTCKTAVQVRDIKDSPSENDIQ